MMIAIGDSHLFGDAKGLILHGVSGEVVDKVGSGNHARIELWAADLDDLGDVAAGTGVPTATVGVGGER